MNTFQTNIRNFCLSVILLFRMSSIIIVDDYFSGQAGNSALCLKKINKIKVISQKWTAFVYVNLHQTFIECLSNQYTHFGTSTWWMLLQVMVRPLILLRFLGIFIHFWQPFRSELLYFHHTFTDCLSNLFWYIKVPNVSTSYGMPLNYSIRQKIDEYLYLKYCIFTKFSHIVHLINAHILLCWYARCNYKLWKVLCFNCSLEILIFDTLFYIKLSSILWKVNENNFNVPSCNM